MILVPSAMEQAIRIYYVVLRSEEHADYVERLYKDRSKAEEFEGNEDEYGRDIERISYDKGIYKFQRLR